MYATDSTDNLTLKSLREKAIKHLLASPFLCRNAPYGRNDAMLDVDILLSFLLKKTRAYVLAHLDEKALNIKENFDNLLEMRYHGTSIAYIIQEKEFFSLSFYVNRSVLIPKADTEILVEASLETISALLCKNKLNERSSSISYEKDAENIRNLNMLDVFSGSGCVGIATVHSLLGKMKNTNRTCCIHCNFLDISSDAIAVSQINVAKLFPVVHISQQGIVQHDMPRSAMQKTILAPSIQTQFSFFCQDARQSFPLDRGENKYDCIMANPPYVPQNKTYELLSDGRDEPHLALDGGTDGFAFFASLAKNAHNALKEGGFLLCEVGDGQAEHVRQIFAQAGFACVESYKDISHTERVVKGKKNT